MNCSVETRPKYSTGHEKPVRLRSPGRIPNSSLAPNFLDIVAKSTPIVDELSSNLEYADRRDEQLAWPKDKQAEQPNPVTSG
jgi:hypothetical protein